MRSLALVALLVGCSHPAPPRPLPSSAPAPVTKVEPGPVVPDEIRSVEGAIPQLAPTEILLMSAAPGTPVVIKDGQGRALPVGDLVIGILAEDHLIAGQASYSFDPADQTEITRPPGGQGGPAVVTRKLEQGDLLHFEVWLVPTARDRIKLWDDASTLDAHWYQGAVLVIGNEHGKLVEPGGAWQLDLADDMGSPVLGPDGALYYRTLDGGAWKVELAQGATPARLGKGKPGTEGSGDLNDGITDPVYPPAVTFDKKGKPKFK